MRVARDAPGVVDEPEVEAEHDLREAVAGLLVERLDDLEARAAQQVRHEHAAARELGVDLGDVRERVPAMGARDRAVVLRLELVVELLGDPLAQLGVDRLHVQAGRQPLDDRQQHREVAQVGVDRLGDARVLHLHRDLTPLARDRAVDLADRCRGEGVVLELREDRRRPVPELLAQQLLDLLERQRRDVVAQLRQRLLEVLALALGQRREVDRGEHLPDLHRRPAHLAELRDELPRERGGPFAGRRLGALGRAHDVRRARTGPARGLPGDEPAEPGGAGDPRGRRPGGFRRHGLQATRRASASRTRHRLSDTTRG